MAIPTAPTITPIAPAPFSPVAAATPVADLSAPEAESYATTSTEFAVTGTQLTAIAEVPAGTYNVAVTATNVEGTGPEGTADLTFADEVVEPPDPPEVPVDDSYSGNPQIPPAVPVEERWRYFLDTATHEIVKHARPGVDFVIAKPDRDTPLDFVYWNDGLLGPKPAEIETYARLLSDEQPWAQP